MSEQRISCECCGSKWSIIYVDGKILARLIECPLCHIKKLE